MLPRKWQVQCASSAHENLVIPRDMNPSAHTFAQFSGLITLAEECLARRELLAAARVAQLAARFAYPASAGLFASPRLERLLVALGDHISIGGRRDRQRRDARRHVLHVLTYGRPVGGDTRYVWRWIQEERDSFHSVAITSQADIRRTFEVPSVLREAARASGGEVRLLGAPTSDPLAQARELMELGDQADVVVLHTFPYDIVPVLALATAPDSVKTVYVNHSDHTFWLGGSVAHCIAHLRRQPTAFSETRRGLRAQPAATLPIPLFLQPPTMNRAAAKRALGYAEDTIVLLTIASPFKYSSPGEAGFLDIALPVVLDRPRVVLLAVGPEPRGAWALAHRQSGGRVIAMSSRWDNDVLYAAADIYLDSIPFSSITSLLEAGSHGAALIGYGPSDCELELLGPGAPGLDDTMMIARDIAGYRQMLGRLIDDKVFRRASGERIQDRIGALHTGAGWLAAIEDVYASVASSTQRGCIQATEDAFQVTELNTRLAYLYQAWDMRQMARNFFSPVSYRVRWRMTWRMYALGFRITASTLLPPPFDRLVLSGGRWTKRSGRALKMRLAGLSARVRTRLRVANVAGHAGMLPGLAHAEPPTLTLRKSTKRSPRTR